MSFSMLAGVALAGIGFLFPLAVSGQTDTTKLERCDRSFGTLAVVEPQNEVIQALTRYGLGTPTTLIRTIAQQSRCFLVVERGAAMENMMRERELARTGSLQQGSNVGQGQILAADFILTPSVLFSEGNAGGIGGIFGGVARRVPLVGGAIAGALKFKEAQTSMLVADVRTGVQLVAAEGKARKSDFSLGALGIGVAALGGAGAYANTNEGKVIAASFLDNFNNIVTAFRADSALARRVPSTSPGVSEGVTAGLVLSEGDVIRPKIDNVRVLAEPNDSARTLATLKRTDEIVYLGEERGGFVRVQSSTAEGWVKKTLVAR